MSDGLWSFTARELRLRTASSDAVPGGGSIAAISGALALALVQMALAVTNDEGLAEFQRKADDAMEAILSLADADAQSFAIYMDASRLPRGDSDQIAKRRQAVERALVQTTEVPLALADRLLDSIALSRDVEPHVHPGVVSDVLAAREMLFGAAQAALHMADTNIDSLAKLGTTQDYDLSPRVSRLRTALSELTA